MATHIKLHTLPSPFAMHRGGQLSGATLAYETWGTLNPQRNNAVLILTGLSADSHAAAHDEHDTPGWWQAMIGPGKAIDTNRWFVVCASSLGSCKGSTGPCSPIPGTGEPYRFSFPDLCLEDIANASADLTRSLGIKQLHAVIGPSMGGMTAQALVLENPGYTRHMINIAAAMASRPFSTAIRSLQREAILKDVNFKNGHYSAENWPVEGMKLARKIGMLSYRSAEEWDERFPRSLRQVPNKPFGIEFPVESYLEHHANKFVHQFDPISYLYLSRAMDWFDAHEHAAEGENPFAQCGLESAQVIGCDTDLLFPPHQQRQLHETLDAAGVRSRLTIVDSIEGHDAFLVDTDTFAPLIRQAMQNTQETRP
jgi:homoserine O-acetyltransferase